MKRTLLLSSIAFCGVAAIAIFMPGVSNISIPASAKSPNLAIPSETPPLPIPPPPPHPVFNKDEDDVIRIDTDLVNLNVRVIDRNNRPVNNLTEKDFTILENGQKQQIEFFSKSELPTSYSLVIDNSGSLRHQINDVIEAGKVLVDSNRPADQTSVIRFVSSQKISVEQPFTDSKEDLHYSLDRLFIEGGQTAVRDAVYLAVQQINEHQERYGDAARRRALILVTDGEDKSSYYTESQLMNLLMESDVQIYTIGFVGDLSSTRGFIRSSEQSRAKSFLERLSTSTGGKAYFPDTIRDLDRIAADISNEMRTQYSIGYLPSDTRNDGTYRSIRVDVVDGPSREKRIAITRTGRTAEGSSNVPQLRQQ